jgi:GNAT superfamily N-acetyltransferase
METIKLKIIETKDEALEAYSLYSKVQLKQSPYYSELIKNPNYIFDTTTFYEYHIHNVSRMVTQQLCCIAVDTTTNKIVSLICGEDLFDEPNPDYPVNKPLFIRLGKDIYNKSLERFIKEGFIEKRKGVYLAFTKVTTHPDYQRRGISSSLFKFAEKVAKEKGLKYIYIDPANPVVIKLVIEKLGYPEIGRLCYKDIEFEGTFPYEGLFKDFIEPYIAYSLKPLDQDEIYNIKPKF